MRTNFPDRATLEKMPLYRLRNLDIHDKEEEILVQEIVSKKLGSQPLESAPAIRELQAMDIKSPAEEKEWQAKVDEKVAKAKEAISQFGNPDSAVPNATPPASVAVSEKFCEFCDSKGARHKKDCIRPV